MPASSIALADGIIVYPARSANPARLPILGLEAIATQRIEAHD